LGSRIGAVVRTLAFHKCDPGSIPTPGVICGLSLLVLYSARRGFFSGYSGFPLSSKTNIWFDLIWLIWLISLIWFDLFDLQSPQLVEHLCLARMICFYTNKTLYWHWHKSQQLPYFSTKKILTHYDLCSRKQPPTISGHLALTFWMVAYGGLTV